LNALSLSVPEEHAAIRRRTAKQVAFFAIRKKESILLKRFRDETTFCKSPKHVAVDTIRGHGQLKEVKNT